MYKLMLLVGVLLLMSGCTVTPDYLEPSTPPPERFNADHNSGHFETAEQRFWQGFDDPLLARLVDDTLATNQTLQGALARYDQASALLKGAQRNQWPSATITGNAAEIYPSSLELVPGNNDADHFTSYQAGIHASWEPDLFGRLRGITESHRAELAARSADIGALQVALVGQLASTYFQLRGLQAQYRVAEENVALYQASLDIVDVRMEAGRGTEFDRVRAAAQLDRAHAELPTLQAAIRSAMHRIAVLTGQPPAALIETLATEQTLPATLPLIPVDSPGAVLRRRPDIAAAEQRLEAATARIGVAMADMFPHFTLGGLLGSVAGDPGDLFTGATASRNVILGVDWTFLDYAKVQARIDAADAESRAALADYRRTVLTVLEEVENRLVYYNRSQAREQRLQQAQTQAQQAVELAHTRHENGLIAYFEVLSAQQELALARDAAVRSRTQVMVAMVDVYRALAGAPGE